MTESGPADDVPATPPAPAQYEAKSWENGYFSGVRGYSSLMRDRASWNAGWLAGQAARDGKTETSEAVPPRAIALREHLHRDDYRSLLTVVVECLPGGKRVTAQTLPESIAMARALIAFAQDEDYDTRKRRIDAAKAAVVWLARTSEQAATSEILEAAALIDDFYRAY